MTDYKEMREAFELIRKLAFAIQGMHAEVPQIIDICIRAQHALQTPASSGHHANCGWNVDQYNWECDCGFLGKTTMKPASKGDEVDRVAKVIEGRLHHLDDISVAGTEQEWVAALEKLAADCIAAINHPIKQDVVGA